MLDSEGRPTKVYKQPELPKTKFIDTQRRESGFEAANLKSMGASAAGEAIRHSPKHNMAVQEFLNRPASEQIKQGLVAKYMTGIGQKYGLGTTLKGVTIGDELVIRRLDAMVSHGANFVLPLDHGHFGASNEAADYFHNPPKMQGANVSGNTIAFHINYPKEAKTLPEAIANLRRAGLAEYIPQPEHELVARMQEAWADSATTNVASVALMHAAAKQRGVPADIRRVTHPDDVGSDIVSIEHVRQEAEREYSSNSGMYDALAYGIHKVSTDHLATQGVTANDHIRVYRGMQPDGATATLVRGWPKSGETVKVSAVMNPISSWSTDRETTRIFGQVAFRWDVPAKEIFATAATGFGAAIEYEVVTYGGRSRRMDVHALPARGDPNNPGDFRPFPVAFSVERTLEFINRNHTPGRGHPNPGYNTSVFPKDTQPVTRKSDTHPVAQGATNVKSVRGHKGMYGTDPERRIPHKGDTVDIYRDLGHGREFKRGFPDDMAFSMRHPSSLPGERTNLVVASTVGVRLANPRPSWATAAKRQAEAKGQRGVHAFVRGEVTEYLTPDKAARLVRDPAWQKVTYYPGTQDFFIPSTRHRVIGGEEAVLSNGQFYVRNPKIVKKPVPVSQIEKRIAEKASVTASVERRLFEEFVNRNHTKTSAHPNMNGAFLAGKREEANSPKILKGADDFPSKATEEFKKGLAERRADFIAGDPVRAKVVDFISKWTGAENMISAIRRDPEEYKEAIDWIREHSIPNDVTLYRSLNAKKGINERIQVGEQIPNRIAASFTEAPDYMTGFRDTRLIIEPLQAHGLPVAWLSNTPHEKEWISVVDFVVTEIGKPKVGGFNTETPITIQEVD